MATVNVLLQHLSVQLLAFRVVTGEALVGVRDEDTSVTGSLHSTEETRTCGCTLETDIKVTLEGSGGILFVQGFSQYGCTVRLGNTLVFVCESEFCESTASTEKTGSIS